VTGREALGAIDLLAGVEPARLDALAAESEELLLAPGEHTWREGEAPAAFYVLVEGEMEAYAHVDGRRMTLTVHQPVTYSGATMILLDVPYGANEVARAPSRVLRVPADAFRRLCLDEPAVLSRVARLAWDVGGRVAQARDQREKLAALGSLSAGLAHELNNPAAAARRDADTARDALRALLDRAPGDGVLARRARAASAHAAGAEPLSGLARADREDELLDVLEDLGIAGAADVAGELADVGLDADWARAVEDPATIPFLAAAVVAERSLEDVRANVGRVSELVQAIKEYSYMDRANEQEIDLHEGLEATLKILGHKLKRADVTVERDFDRTLPRLTAFGSELNQVWTNLVDNAIAAAPGGTIRITTARVGDRARVEVADDGTGIAPEAQARIFEPFFTTKDVGQGTGLGLDIAYRIVTQHHHGALTVQSRPGDTRFEVDLPLDGG
jgi:signal transduction histidine kinase